MFRLTFTLYGRKMWMDGKWFFIRGHQHSLNLVSFSNSTQSSNYKLKLHSDFIASVFFKKMKNLFMIVI